MRATPKDWFDLLFLLLGDSHPTQLPHADFNSQAGSPVVIDIAFLAKAGTTVFLAHDATREGESMKSLEEGATLTRNRWWLAIGKSSQSFRSALGVFKCPFEVPALSNIQHALAQ